MITQMRRLPDQLVKTVTWDRGSEMVQYPASRWHWTRGSTSATRTHPGSAARTKTPTGCCVTGREGTDLSGFTAEDLDTIADKLNNRPRPTLNLETPKQRMRHLINTAA